MSGAWQGLNKLTIFITLCYKMFTIIKGCDILINHTSKERSCLVLVKTAFQFFSRFDLNSILRSLFVWPLPCSTLCLSKPRGLRHWGARILSMDHKVESGDRKPEPVLLLLSCSGVFDSLRPYGLQHARYICPPLPPEVCSDSCPLNRWCYLTISSSATPFSSCLHSFSASCLFQ